MVLNQIHSKQSKVRHNNCRHIINIKIMKQSITSTVFFVAATIFVACFSYAQSQEQITSETIGLSPDLNQRVSYYMQIHNDYKNHLDPLNIENQILKDSLEEYRIDTAINYSISENPKRYIYTYSADGYRLTTLLQVNENDEWENFSTETCTYDSNGNKLTTLWQSWENGNWVNATKITYTYTTNNNILTCLEEIWENGIWVNSDKGTYTYDAYGNPVAYLEEIWGDGEWVNYTNEIYTYDSLSNMLTAFGELWADSTWINDQRHTYTYNLNGAMLTGLSEFWEEGTWNYSYKETYTYDSSNNRLSFIGESWADSLWINHQRYSYTYNELDYLVTSIGENWEDSMWVNNEKSEFIYDTYGGVETALIQTWEDSAWINYSLSQYSYDDFGNAIVGNYYNWDGNTWLQNQDGLIKLFYDYSTSYEYFTGYRVNATYTSITVDEREIKNGQISNYYCYPNPANGSTNLTLSIEKYLYLDISLFSMSGKKVKTIYQGALTKGMHQFTIETGNLPAGIYFTNLSANNYTKSFKLLIKNK